MNWQVFWDVLHHEGNESEVSLSVIAPRKLGTSSLSARTYRQSMSSKECRSSWPVMNQSAKMSKCSAEMSRGKEPGRRRRCIQEKDDWLDPASATDDGQTKPKMTSIDNGRVEG
ncbi:hypothetical protein KCU87_g181, partial [Aureobasidium melanogenum]